MPSSDWNPDFLEDEPAEPGGLGFDLQDVIEIVQRRWRWLLVGSVVGLVIGTAAWWILPRKYVATTSILVEPQEVPESYVRSTITLDVAQRIHTLQQRVTSIGNLETLIQRVGRDRLDPSRQLSHEALIGQIAENLEVSVDSPRRSGPASIVEIRFKGRHPEALAETIRQITELFIAENRKDRAKQAASTETFLDTQLSRIRDDVSAHEKRISDFGAEQMGALPSELDSNHRELDRLTEALRSNLEAQERLRLNLATAARTQVMESSLGASLEAARDRLREARRLYTDEHPILIALRKQVSELELELERALAAAETDGGDNDALIGNEVPIFERSLAARQRDAQELRARIVDVERRLSETPKNERRMLELSRDYETLKDSYKLMLGNKHDAALARNLEAAQMSEQFTLLRPAQTPTKPFFPNPFIVIPGGLAGGLGLAVLLVAWVEVRTPAFHSVETLARRLGLPILAAIPELVKARIYDGVDPPEKLDWRLVVENAPHSSAAEQYRGFTPHFLARPNCRIILVTSAQPGDGKSITCTNLACTLASDLGRRVLLMDCDLRRATQHKIANVGREPGVADILQGDADLRECIRQVTPNLSLLPAGTTPENPLALLTSEAFLKLCEQATENYEVVMIDSPPILPVIDAKILHTMADMVVFVVRAGVSPSGAVVRCMKELRDVGGIVFNRVSQGGFQRYYYYDAYSYSAYGEDGTGTASDPSAGSKAWEA